MGRCQDRAGGRGTRVTVASDKENDGAEEKDDGREGECEMKRNERRGLEKETRTTLYSPLLSNSREGSASKIIVDDCKWKAGFALSHNTWTSAKPIPQRCGKDLWKNRSLPRSQESLNG